MVKSDKHEHILRILGDVSCFSEHMTSYLQAEKKPPHGQAHLLFPKLKAKAQKNKRTCPFPTHDNIMNIYTK